MSKYKCVLCKKYDVENNLQYSSRMNSNLSAKCDWFHEKCYCKYVKGGRDE